MLLLLSCLLPLTLLPQQMFIVLLLLSFFVELVSHFIMHLLEVLAPVLDFYLLGDVLVDLTDLNSTVLDLSNKSGLVIVEPF